MPTRAAAPRARALGPWQIVRAEWFIRATIAEPFTIGDVAAHRGISLRSLQHGSRRWRQTPPQALVAARRLELVRTRLRRAAPGETVTLILAGLPDHPSAPLRRGLPRP